jgi:hypothetical protein
MERTHAIILARRSRTAGAPVVTLEMVFIGTTQAVIDRAEWPLDARGVDVRRAARDAAARTAAKYWPGATVRPTAAGGCVGAWIVVSRPAEVTS